MKIKIQFSCVECGHTQTKWSGQCPTCAKWNTFKEEVPVAPGRFFDPSLPVKKPLRIREIGDLKHQRIMTGFKEFNRLMGSGVVPGSLTLVGGDPGIGKSTLMLQLSQSFAEKGLTVLYICGEESCEQTSLRAKRLDVVSDHLYLFNETDLQSIKNQVEELKPTILIVDSIQIVYKADIASAPGSVTQVREVTMELMHLAKQKQIATFIIGHVTKSGEIAGPKILEHLVDTVLYFEGDRQQANRIVRVIKNRFGPTDEIGVFQMENFGLKEVENPSQIFLEERQKGIVGSCIIPTLEGSRPLLIEAQALVTPTSFATPSRKSTGLDPNRVALLIAVLEKKVGFHFHKCDVFVSIAGGLKIFEPSVDLGVLLSIASSWKNRPLDPDCVVIGEVGLGGEVRSAPKLSSRLKEAALLGFKKAVVPKKSLKGLNEEIQEKISLIGVDRVEEALECAFNWR